MLQKETIAVIGGNATMGVRVAYPIQFCRLVYLIVKIYIFVKFCYIMKFFCSVIFPGGDTQQFLRPDDNVILNKLGFAYYGEGYDVSFILIFSHLL